jgi:hypothetical protein
MPDSPQSSLVIFVLIKPPPTSRALGRHASRGTRLRRCGLTRDARHAWLDVLPSMRVLAAHFGAAYPGR